MLLIVSQAPLQAAEWKTIPNCELDDSAYADGDSFHVRAGSRNYIIRLYFVDCAETDESFPGRNADQAAYWKVDAKRVLQLGEEAAQFTKKKLANRFTVITKLEDARGESNKRRYYGFVLPEEGKETWPNSWWPMAWPGSLEPRRARPKGRTLKHSGKRCKNWKIERRHRSLGGGAVKPSNQNEDFFNRAKSAGIPPDTYSNRFSSGSVFEDRCKLAAPTIHCNRFSSGSPD